MLDQVLGGGEQLAQLGGMGDGRRIDAVTAANAAAALASVFPIEARVSA